MLTLGQVWDFERVIQVEQSNVYRLSAHAERHCVADEVSYLERLVNARKLLMEQRSAAICAANWSVARRPLSNWVMRLIYWMRF